VLAEMLNYIEVELFYDHDLITREIAIEIRKIG
jgi:hypothetical protein